MNSTPQNLNSEEQLSIKLQEITADTDMTDTQFIKILNVVKAYASQSRRDELESHRGDAIEGGKAGIVMSYDEVEKRLAELAPKGDKK